MDLQVPYFAANFSETLNVQTEASLCDSGLHRVRLPTAEWVLESANSTSNAFTQDGQLHMQNNGPYFQHEPVRFSDDAMRANTMSCSC